MATKGKEIIYFILLTAIYLACIFRYYPDQPLNSLQATGLHLLDVSPYVIGLTILIVSLFSKISKERLPWSNVARIYLTVGLVIEFFYGLYNYLDMAGKSANL